jgi:predicted DsbA family dithiol-disulfide isomerase
VRADERRAAALGITGVPFYLLDGRYGLSGAQPAHVFEAALRHLAAEREHSGTLDAAEAGTPQ